MNYQGLIIRPPNEANSLIFQITTGCSHNRCTFCPAYKNKSYRIKPLDDIFADIDAASKQYATSVRRVFLCDGDPLAIPQQPLVQILDRIITRFPRLQRTGIYARAGNILKKSPAELQELKKRRLGIVYMGLESGDQNVLDFVQKADTVKDMITAAKRIKEAGIKLNVTVLLGLGGKRGSRDHAEKTIDALNRMQPNHAAALTLMLVQDAPLYEMSAKGGFQLPDKFEMVRELRDMIAGSHLENCLFFSNHASNFYPLSIRLPRDKNKTVDTLDLILSQKDERRLRDDMLRAL